MITNAGQKVPNLETGFTDIQGLPLSITMASSADVVCVTYNMHGFNQGCHYLKYLCSVSDFVFKQEYWLYPSNLHLMQRISNEFVCFSSSAMSSATDRDRYRYSIAAMAVDFIVTSIFYTFYTL